MSRIINVKRHLRKLFGSSSKVVKVKSHNRKIKVPPNLTNVKYYTNKNYVATGLDSKGRLQYIYPESFKKRMQTKKFNRVKRLDKQSTNLLRKISSDSDKGIPEAQAAYTMYVTGFRPGTEKDTQADKKAYGVLSLKDNHVKVNDGKVKFDFIGKKGVRIQKEVKDKRLAGIMKARLKEDNIFDTSSSSVRDYLRKKTGANYNLKDLRTLKAKQVAGKVKSGDRKEIGKKVSEELVNTPKVALDYYVGPK